MTSEPIKILNQRIEDLKSIDLTKGSISDLLLEEQSFLDEFGKYLENKDDLPKTPKKRVTKQSDPMHKLIKQTLKGLDKKSKLNYLLEEIKSTNDVEFFAKEIRKVLKNDYALPRVPSAKNTEKLIKKAWSVL